MFEDTDTAFEFQAGDYEAIFEEAIKAVESRYGPLSQDGVPKAAPDPAAELLHELKDKKGETAEFSPSLSVLPLRKKHFDAHNLDLPTRIDDLMRRYNFYLVRVPVTLMPRPGLAFTRLQCIIEFNSTEGDARRPTIHALFPTDEWQTIIQAHQGLEIGLDNRLTFKAALSDLQVEQGPLSGEADVLVAPGLVTSAGLILGKFNYSIKRPKIISTGEGNVKARWFLDSEEFFEREELWLGIVIQVPKDVERVDAAGALLAYRNPRWLTGHLSDVLELISTKSAQFFKRGAPIENTHLWTDITKA
ncbi:MAG: hypothetical protein JXR84_18460 [Anaerolineae bacterium]|nr:hypothetical protein [Anaerolineae bacterium]